MHAAIVLGATAAGVLWWAFSWPADHDYRLKGVIWPRSLMTQIPRLSIVRSNIEPGATCLTR